MKDLTGKGKPFHSALDKAAALLKRKVGTGAEFMQELKGLGGIKQAEIDERKLAELAGMPKMTHEQFLGELGKRPMPKIGERVFGEEPSQEEVIREANKDIRHYAGEYASDNAETSKEYRDLYAQEAARLRGKHRGEITRSAREYLTEPTHHEDYTLPGGENYREILIKAPKQNSYWAQKYGGERVLFSDPDEASKYAGSSGQAGKVEGAPEQFEGVRHHFGGEGNILASMRVKDRLVPDLEGEHNVKIIGGGGTSNKKFKTRAEAEAFADVKHQGGYRTEITPTQMKKLLHLEELQSDWHQQGREKGYGPKTEKSVEAYYMTKDGQRIPVGFGKTKEEAEANIDVGWKNLVDIKYDNIERKIGEGVPDAPFKKNWEEMALKRLVHQAAEKGYHGIVVTPGAEQADRYSLAKHLENVDIHKNQDGTYNIIGNAHGAESFRTPAIQEFNIPENKLENYVGKDLAIKAVNEGGGKYGGLDLTVGGEGMKGFYDKKVPNILNAIGKKHGVKTQLHGHNIQGRGRERTEEEFREATANVPFERHKEFDYMPKPIPLHYFPITEDMRKDVLTNGLPLYKEGGIIRKAEGGNVQLTVEQMRQQLMAAGRPLSDISQVGVQEAPNLPVKSFVIPNNGAMGPLPIGGIDMEPQQPGQQMLPANMMQPQPNPLMPQPPQAPAGAPQGGSNILQMTPQGQKMAALSGSPQGNLPTKMAVGGPVPVQNHPFMSAGDRPMPFIAKEGGVDNRPMNNDYSDNGATDFSIDNIQQLAKGGKAEKKLHYDPAPALSKAEIEDMAERIARQMSGLENPNQKTLQQLAREQNLSVGIKGSKKMDVPTINFEELKDSYTVGVPGDPSRGGVKPTKAMMRDPKAGEYLQSIGGEKLERPVGMYGGKDYGAYGHPEGWASDLGASAGMFNVVKRLHEENPERGVYGHYHKMTPESLNHALHMLDAVLSYHRPHASPAERIAMLNDLMRKQKTTTSKHDVPYPEFPGFENPEDIMLQAQLNSGMRKKIIGLLGKEKYFPGGKQKIDDIIFAISHPELRNIETGAGGSSILKFDPKRSLKESMSPHPTYGYDIPSKLVGKTRYITPAELLAPRSMANAKREIAAMGKKVVPFNQAKLNIIREPIDEQYINQMGEYERAMKKRLGYKAGGKVKLSTNMDTINLELSKSRKKAK